MSIYQKGTKYKQEVLYDREVYQREGKIHMNKRYRQGVMFEYEVREWLKDRGWIVVRSAGSKTTIDLVAVRNNQTLLIQCKKGTRPAKQERVNMSILEQRTGKNIQVLLAYKPKYGRAIEWYSMREEGKLTRIYI